MAIALAVTGLPAAVSSAALACSRRVSYTTAGSYSGFGLVPAGACSGTPRSTSTMCPSHHNASAAAELALCGARLDKFWALHDLLFKYQETWAPLKEPGPFLSSLIDSARAPREPMEQCLTTGAARPEIEADAQAALRSGAQSTPTFYIEGGLLVGAQPVALWRAILDSIYKAKKGVNGKQ